MRRVRSRSAAPLTQVHAPGSRRRLLRGPRPSRRPRRRRRAHRSPIRTPPRITAPEPIDAPRSTTRLDELQSVPVCSAPAVVRRARPLVVDEHHAVADEDLVLDRDAVADERVALDLAARADHGARAGSRRTVPIARVVADRAAVEVRERLDDDAVAEARRRRAGGTARRWPDASATVEEVRDRLDDRRELPLGDAREDRQREHFRGESLCDRERRRARSRGPRRRPRGVAAPGSAGPWRSRARPGAPRAAVGLAVRIT